MYNEVDRYYITLKIGSKVINLTSKTFLKRINNAQNKLK